MSLKITEGSKVEATVGKGRDEQNNIYERTKMKNA